MKFLNILKNCQIVFLKFSSILIMASIFLFLWLKSGLVGIGDFATYATILAPIVMFSQFRYVEYINSAKSYQEKADRFVEALFASQTVICILLSLLFVVFFLSDMPLLIIVLAGLYKVFELFSDLYVSFLVSVNNIGKAFFVVFSRLLLIIVSLIILFFINVKIDDILCVYLLLFLIYFLCFLYDYFIFSKIRVNKNSKKLLYVKTNFFYGINSLLISLNSLAPRYFFIYFNDKKGLGVFTIVYLLASTSTTLMQFLVSTKVLMIEKFIDGNYRKYFVINFIVIIFCMFLYLLVNIVYSEFFIFLFSYLVMFCSLLLRGVNLTAAVSKDMKKIMNISLIIPMLAVSLLLIALCYYLNSFNIQLSVFYVFLSSVFTSVIIVFFMKKKVRVC